MRGAIQNVHAYLFKSSLWKTQWKTLILHFIHDVFSFELVQVKISKVHQWRTYLNVKECSFTCSSQDSDGYAGIRSERKKNKRWKRMRHSKMKPTAAWSELLGGVASRRHPKTKPTGAGSELLIGVASPRHTKMKPTGAGSESLIGVASRLYRYDDRRGLKDIWKRVDPRFQYGPSSRTRSWFASDAAVFIAAPYGPSNQEHLWKRNDCIKATYRKENADRGGSSKDVTQFLPSFPSLFVFMT